MPPSHSLLEGLSEPAITIDADCHILEANEAYRERSLACHPDKVAHLDPDFLALAERKFRELKRAHDLLTAALGPPGLACGACAGRGRPGRETRRFRRAGATVDLLDARTDLGPGPYADFVEHWIAEGATIVGGCCEVGPAHIAEITRRVRGGE